MNILQINKYHYFRGGSETVFLNMIDLLTEAGHNVAPFSTIHPKNLPSPYEKYFVDAPEMRDLSTLNKIKSIPRFFNNPEASRNLQKLIDDFRPDVAHLHNIFNGLSLSILPVLERNNIPVVITIHDSRFICPSTDFNNKPERCANCLKWGGIKCGVYRCFEGNFLNSWMTSFEMMHKEHILHYDKYIDRYHFVSKHFRDNYALRHSYFGEKGTVFYQYVPTLDTVIPDFRRGDYFLYFGRLTEEKGIVTLVDAMKLCPDIKLKVAGTGPLLQSLKDRNYPNVDFLGFKHGKELRELIEGASFIITPSQWEENNPMTVCEAYSFGKPVIVTERISEFVTPDSGFSFPQRDVSALSSVIRNAATIGDNEYQRLAHGARKFCETNFYNRENYTHKLMELYKDTIEAHKNKQQ